MRRSIPLILLALAIALGASGRAEADPDFVEGVPDGGTHTWCYYDVPTLRSTMDAAMTRLRDQTIVDTAYHSSCLDHTDVRWYERAAPDDSAAYGEALCRQRWSIGRCDRYAVYLNKAAIESSTDPSAQFRKTACHELGHSLGLSHYGVYDPMPGNDTTHSCMRSGDVLSSWWWIVYYGDHHKSAHLPLWF